MMPFYKLWWSEKQISDTMYTFLSANAGKVRICWNWQAAVGTRSSTPEGTYWVKHRGEGHIPMVGACWWGVLVCAWFGVWCLFCSLLKLFLEPLCRFGRAVGGSRSLPAPQWGTVCSLILIPPVCIHYPVLLSLKSKCNIAFTVKETEHGSALFGF